jgi:hypothetical protein
MSALYSTFTGFSSHPSSSYHSSSSTWQYSIQYTVYSIQYLTHAQVVQCQPIRLQSGIKYLGKVILLYYKSCIPIFQGCLYNILAIFSISTTNSNYLGSSLPLVETRPLSLGVGT